MIERYNLAQIVAREAGALAMDYFARLGSLEITHKGPQDMASEADLASEALIRDRLLTAFPEDGFLGEEGGLEQGTSGDAKITSRSGDAKISSRSGGLWVVDPIDGTQPFLSGMTTWCISIAYVVGDDIQIGVVYHPPADEMFAAHKGQGAFLNGHPMRGHAGGIRDGLVGMGASNRLSPPQVIGPIERLLQAGGLFHRNGSGALSLCYVACGRLVGYYEPHINSWDCLAGILLNTEAGCRVNNFLAGNGLLGGNPIIAATASAYDELVSIALER